MQITTHALVLRQVLYKESDMILTMMTQEMGKITATARGCRRKNSQLAAGCQQLVWGEFVLSEYQGRWTVKEVAVESPFIGLTQDVFRLSLGCYFAEVGELLSIEELPQQDLLSLILNCLYVLDKRQDLPMDMVKAVFELRAACQSGYEPMLDGCAFCGEHPPLQAQLSMEHGTIHCRHCGGKGFPLTDSTLAALLYITHSPPKEVFQFTLNSYDNLGALSECYLLTQLERGFKTLDFYKKLNAI